MARAKLPIANHGVLLVMTLLRQRLSHTGAVLNSLYQFAKLPSQMWNTVPVSHGPNYLGVSLRSASSCTDFVVADLSIVDLVGRPHAAGGFVICLANTR
jgi:hypothetical protein